MNYVISDIHGCYDAYCRLLKKIHFSDEDMLYVLGDAVDRGPEPIRLLQDLMMRPNVIFILGNHEYMMLQYLSPDATDIAIRRWNRNGNAPTLAAYLRLKAKTQQRILDYLNTRPSHLEMDVNGRSFYLVHAWPGENVHDEVWKRPEIGAANPKPGYQVIVGHTKVLSMIKPDEARIRYAIDLEERGGHLRILHTPGFVNIDCGCGYDMPIKALACIRLEDKEEYYI